MAESPWNQVVLWGRACGCREFRVLGEWDHLALLSQSLEQVHCFLFAQSDVLREDLPSEARRNRR
jgi:hypothetical protein